MRAPVVGFALLTLSACASHTPTPARPPVAQATAPALPEGWTLPGGSGTVFDSSPNAYSLALRTLDAENRRGFAVGNAFFNDNWVAAPASTEGRDGLGPLFHAPSCSSCHLRDGRSSVPDDEATPLETAVVAISVPQAAGGPLPHPIYGKQIQPRALPGIPPEATVRVQWSEQPGAHQDGALYSLRAPTLLLESPGYGPLPDDLQTSLRVAPAVFGLGLLEALSSTDILAAEDPEDGNGDGISGRGRVAWSPSLGRTALGRFGWKAGSVTLRDQTAAAFAQDIGITSPDQPAAVATEAQTQARAAPDGGTPEIDEHKLERVALYLRGLAPPARPEPSSPRLSMGAALFREIGCSGCHRPSYTTPPDALPSALANQTIWPYTDLLLHDMGSGLADGRPEGNASAREWRTPPLWGLHLLETVSGHQQLLHDGRARGVEEAILWHGGEGAASQVAYRGLSTDERAALLLFVSSL